MVNSGAGGEEERREGVGVSWGRRSGSVAAKNNAIRLSSAANCYLTASLASFFNTFGKCDAANTKVKVNNSS